MGTNPCDILRYFTKVAGYFICALIFFC